MKMYEVEIADLRVFKVSIEAEDHEDAIALVAEAAEGGSPYGGELYEVRDAEVINIEEG